LLTFVDIKVNIHSSEVLSPNASQSHQHSKSWFDSKISLGCNKQVYNYYHSSIKVLLVQNFVDSRQSTYTTNKLHYTVYWRGPTVTGCNDLFQRGTLVQEIMRRYFCWKPLHS